MSVLGRMAVATLMLMLAVGCGGGESAPTGPAAGPARQSIPAESTAALVPDNPQASSNKIITVRISQGRVEGVPAEVEVDRGTRVRIEVTSDRTDELHVHGYDKTVPLASDSPGTVEFVADVPGVFEVETHDSGLLLFQLVVRE